MVFIGRSTTFVSPSFASGFHIIDSIALVKRNVTSAGGSL